MIATQDPKKKKKKPIIMVFFLQNEINTLYHGPVRKPRLLNNPDVVVDVRHVGFCSAP